MGSWPHLKTWAMGNGQASEQESTSTARATSTWRGATFAMCRCSATASSGVSSGSLRSIVPI
eukprot:2753183-Alexandrium_andersonii.AAC.1